MMNKTCILLAFFLQALPINAKNQQTIPFIHQSVIPPPPNIQSFMNLNPYKMQSSISQSEKNTTLEEITNIPIDKLKEIIKLFRTEMCKINQNGSFKLALSIDASGKIIGIGISATSGLEVNINCNDQNHKALTE
ncbi:MAG: hypothetical protein KF798_07760 [Candidatus Paracaedibacteraceae bacterium]|nr:hypothetical protein [Candidatus Paracaedibacteraceae bacterium]